MPVVHEEGAHHVVQSHVALASFALLCVLVRYKQAENPHHPEGCCCMHCLLSRENDLFRNAIGYNLAYKVGFIERVVPISARPRQTQLAIVHN